MNLKKRKRLIWEYLERGKGWRNNIIVMISKIKEIISKEEEIFSLNTK